MHTTDPHEHPTVEQQFIVKVMKSDLSGTDQTGNFREMTATTINGQTDYFTPCVCVGG